MESSAAEMLVFSFRITYFMCLRSRNWTFYP